MKSTRSIRLGLLACLFASQALAQEVADRIWLGGPIHTMNDAAMTVEAVAEKDGRILFVGSADVVMEHKGDTTELVDLDGRAMVPGFIDSHGHVVMGGIQALSANLLAPPDGTVQDIASLVVQLKEWASNNRSTVEAVNLIVGFGYDPAQLAEQRHPTREDLDAVSTDFPVYIVHQSGHIGVTNTKGLEVLELNAASEDVPGGVIRRGPGGDPDGVLEGNVHFSALGNLFGSLGQAGFLELGRAGTKLWASYGFTTAQEGRAVPLVVDVLNELAELQELEIDVAVYPDVMVDRDFVAANQSRDYVNRVRIAGGKLTLDGSPQGFTALRDRPYYDPVGEYPPGYTGIAYETMETVIDMVDWAFENNVQLLSHANGEGASDRLIAAVEAATKKHGDADRRPVLIHGQFLREDQVDSYKRLGVFPSLFPMHTFYWGDWHRDHTVGPARADNISPTGWMVQRGMKFGSHHDAPVAFPDSMRVLDATVTRRSRSGDIIGPAQRVDVITALKSMTLWSAYQHFEEDEKGSIETGKLADFVILSSDPLAIDPEDLETLRVAETIKEGKTIYRRNADRGNRIEPGSPAEKAFAGAIKGMVAQHELASLPAALQDNFIVRTGLMTGRHDAACVPSALMSILLGVKG
ncbi:amidohydrolase [Roseibium sp. MMSF_3544]|uniref:amidohydrolase n=1 Tax=unclassified Roseibium TaxID=2629323 RepID=UPI00273DF6B8|nr:amidohydrolase [Roseibium sp. MMSF_3544]